MKKYALVIFAITSLIVQTGSASALNSSVSVGQKCLKSQIGKAVKSNGRSLICTKTARGQVWKSKGPKSTGKPAVTKTTLAAPKIYTGSTTWGEVSVTAIFPPRQGECSEIPIRIDIRGKVGLGFGLIVSVEDAYQNEIGEMTRLTSDQQLAIGISDYSIKVCGDPWVFTYPSGVTLPLSAVKYCGLNVNFFPYQRPIQYMFSGC